MTKEQRLELLKQIEKDIYVPSIESTFLDDAKSCAIHSVIEELEQEPCEDAISRQAVIDAIYDMEILKYRIDLENVIKALPPIKPQEKTGHWKLQPSNKEQGERDFIWWKCSKCGQVIFSETEKDRREYHAFCGRCGAKMVEPQERSE